MKKKIVKPLGNPDDIIDIDITVKGVGFCKDETISYHTTLKMVEFNEIPNMVSIIYKNHKFLYRVDDIKHISITPVVKQTQPKKISFFKRLRELYYETV